MVINDKNNFVSMVARLLKGLGYSDVKENTADSAIDITAVKDGENYCFKCRYDIDAVGSSYIKDFAEASGNYDKRVFVTNSSFLSAAKKLGEEQGIILWDRNTIDRMYIGVSDSLEDRREVVNGSKAPYVIAGVIAAVVIIAVVYWFMFK